MLSLGVVLIRRQLHFFIAISQRLRFTTMMTSLEQQRGQSRKDEADNSADGGPQCQRVECTRESGVATCD